MSGGPDDHTSLIPRQSSKCLRSVSRTQPRTARQHCMLDHPPDTPESSGAWFRRASVRHRACRTPSGRDVPSCPCKNANTPSRTGRKNTDCGHCEPKKAPNTYRTATTRPHIHHTTMTSPKTTCHSCLVTTRAWFQPQITLLCWAENPSHTHTRGRHSFQEGCYTTSGIQELAGAPHLSHRPTKKRVWRRTAECAKNDVFEGEIPQKQQQSWGRQTRKLAKAPAQARVQP